MLCILSHTLWCVLALSSAVDSRTGSKVAIKKLYRPFQSELFAKRAYRELRLLKHMKHENVSYGMISAKWRGSRPVYVENEVSTWSLLHIVSLSAGDWSIRCVHCRPLSGLIH